MTTYRDEVVKPGDAASKLAKQVNRESYDNCEAIDVIDSADSTGFRNPVGFLWSWHICQEMANQDRNHWTITETVENDGNGGKPQFYTLVPDVQVFRGQASDLIAMTADDLARSGRFPAIMISNEVNVQRATKENFHLIKALFEGFADGLKASHLASLTGEFAVMKYSITAFCDQKSDDQLILTWGGTCLGLMRREKLINNADIKPRMIIVGFWEGGYGANGGGRMTKLLLDLHDGDVSAVMSDPETMEFVRELAIPCKSYGWALSRAHGWLPDGSLGTPHAKIVGTAHITGGGLWGKFGEILPEGVGAVLSEMPVPCDALLRAQQLSRKTSSPISDWECCDTFHGSCRMLVVCPDEDNAKKLIRSVNEYGIIAKIVGQTVESNNNLITIDSRFLQGGQLRSDAPPSA